MLTRLVNYTILNTTTSPQTTCKHLRGRIRDRVTDRDDRNNSSNNNQEEEVARQTARTQEIKRHWHTNVHAAYHGKQEEATCAANAGFQLAEQLYHDIANGTRSVSRIAFDQLKELVRFCMSYAFKTGSSTWYRYRNSISARRLPPAQMLEQEDNWMVLRGLWLIYDLYFDLQLDLDVRSLSRQILVDMLHFASGICSEYEIRAYDTITSRTSMFEWWGGTGQQVLKFLIDLGKNSTDRIISDAAENARLDSDLRKKWRQHQKDERWREAQQGILLW